MATRGKEPQPGKERRGNSPSQKKSSSSLKQASSGPNKRNDSTISARNIPNYLKPTISSGFDSSKHQVKKVSSGDNLIKAAAVARRRSFEKPLLVSQALKTRISPNPRERSSGSSSFTSRTTTSQKPLSDGLLSKVSKGVSKDHSVHPRQLNVKKSSLSEKKRNTQATVTSGEAPRTSPPPGEEYYTLVAGIPQLDVQEDLSSSITEAEEALLNFGNNSAVPHEELAVVEDKVHENLTESEHKSGKVDHELKIVESSIEAKLQYETTDGKIEGAEEKLQSEKVTCNDLQLEEHGEIESANSHREENAEKGPKSKIDKIGDGGASEDFHSKTMEEDEEQEQEEVNATQGEVLDWAEKESIEDVPKEAMLDADNAETKLEVVQGKKDSAPLSNDVIEETASKLREQRKNKVKALAGAFETVISLQDK